MKTLFSILAASVLVPSAFGAIVVDGTLDATGYGQAAGPTAPVFRTGFGAGADASEIWVGEDLANLYFFIQAQLPLNNDGVLVIVGTPSQAGDPTGTGLGNIGGLGAGNEVFGDTGNNNWRIEFEADQGWFFSTAGGAGNAFVNTGNWVANTKGFLGNAGGAPLTAGGNTYATNNAGNFSGPGSSTGIEIRLDRSNLGGVPPSVSVFSFAVVVSNTAFFSDDGAPASNAGNPGFNPDFTIIGTASDQRASHFTALPVELSVFSVE